MGSKGQFSVISALLVAVILIATVIMTYSTIRNARIQDQPKILSAIDETNFAIKQILGFTVGYYCSVLQVTGNSTYAKNLTMNYLESGLINLANIHPEWGTSLNASNKDVYTYWFTSKSYSTGSLAITYNLTGLGVYGVSYDASCKLMVEIQNTTSSNQARLNVTKDEGEPILTLGKQNFKFYRYKYTNSTWEYAYPVNDTSIKPFSNGTYVIDMPPGLDSHSYVIQVEDQRGLSVAASSFDNYVCSMNFSTWSPSWWNTSYGYRKPIVVMNNVASPLSSGYSVVLNMNTSSLVSAGKMSASGNDLRIVRWNGSSWNEIDRDIIGMNTSSTQVWFKTQTQIGPSPTADYSYYVYYGNSSAANPPTNRSNVYLWFDDFSTNTTNKYNIDRHANDWHGPSTNIYHPYWDPSDNAVYFDTDNDYVGGWMPNALNETNVYAEMKMKITGSYPSSSTNGILLRWQNKDTFLGGDISGGPPYNSSCLVKDRRDNEIAHATPTEYHPWNEWFTFAVAANGTSLRLWVNGVSKVNATDTRIVPGKISFLVAQAKGWMDDFKIRKYVEPEPAASVSAEEAFPNWSLPLQDVTIIVELLQNGTMRWLGQNLQLTTQALPIPPIPVKAIHVNQTVGSVNCEVPFQIEDWASEYKIPLGLTNNASLFSSTTMLVFLVNSSVSNVTIWWDGSDSAMQTSCAYTNRYFTGDDESAGILTNGILTLRLSSGFTVVSTLGSSNQTTNFMRINNTWSSFGASQAYVIHHGVVRDVVQQEAEWSGGAPGCPNLYTHIVLTLPANATYYTYQLRMMFVESSLVRNISDICLLQTRATISKDKWGASWSKTMIENGTSAGYPTISTISNTTRFFYNQSTVWQHHWNELVENNHGFGIIMGTEQNIQLYALDKIAGTPTGGLNMTDSQIGTSQTVTIEVKPASSLAMVSFTQALDLTWSGAVVTFDGEKPIYPDAGGTNGLWLIAEFPPSITVNTEN